MKSLKSYVKDLGNRHLHSEWLRRGVYTVLSGYSRYVYPKSEKLYYLISTKKKFIFLINPLVASQSMREGLISNAERQGYDIEFGGFNVNTQLKQELLDYHRFCIVRNPWERAVSCYHKKVTNANTSLKLLLISRFPEISLDMTFDGFVDFLCSPAGADVHSDTHWMSQHHLLTDSSNLPLWNEFYKLEDFPDSMYQAVAGAGIENFEIPRIGGSEQMKLKRPQGDYRSYYSDQTWAKIAERYAQDIKAFNYQEMV